MFNDLHGEGLISVRGERAPVIDDIFNAIKLNFDSEQNLERDAERLLDETMASMGRGAAEIDRRRMLKMIKDKLARERKIVL